MNSQDKEFLVTLSEAVQLLNEVVNGIYQKVKEGK